MSTGGKLRHFAYYIWSVVSFGLQLSRLFHLITKPLSDTLSVFVRAKVLKIVTRRDFV